MISKCRDYSLLGRDGEVALENGLARSNWYQTEIPRKSLAALMKPSDGPAIRDTLILVVAMVGLASVAGILYGSLLSLPFSLAYGVLYGSAMDSRWHECGHKTARDTLDERRRLSDSLFLYDSEPTHMAMEPRASH